MSVPRPNLIAAPSTGRPARRHVPWIVLGGFLLLSFIVAWYVASQIEAHPRFGPGAGWGAGGSVFLVGASLSLVLFWVMRSELRARTRAERTAAELLRSEEAVRASEHRFRTLFEQSPLSIQVFAPDGACVLANHAWEELWGARMADLAGYNVLNDAQLARGGLSDEIRRAFAGTAVVIPPFRYDPATVGRVGRVRWVQAQLYPVHDGAGAVQEMVLILQDVTGVREAQASAERSGQQLRLVIDALPALVAYIGADGRYQFVNHRYEQWFGLPAGDLTGKHMGEVLGAAGYAAVAPYVEAVLGGRPVTFEMSRAYPGDGMERAIGVHYLPDHGPDGHVRGFVSVVNDITERRGAEQERARLLAAEREARAGAEAANRVKDEFLATLSHELRTPLNAILGWTQLLRMGGIEGEDFDHALETVERNARVQAQLVEDLLDLSRIITGKLRLEPRMVDLPGAVDAALDSVRPMAAARGVRIIPVLDASATPVLGDAARLQQVAWNLLSNAIKFTPDGGRVEVYLTRHAPAAGSGGAGHAELVVSDTGIGIKPEFLPHVFERLRQADSSSTRRHGGLGLGLAIVRHLVELHGGTITARSAGEGKGATFAVTVPLATPEAVRSTQAMPSATRAAQDAEGAGALVGVRVLLVDDEPDAREVIGRMLVRAGAEITTASSARQALELISRSPPDVLLSDISMPVEDGYWLIRAVRALDGEAGGRVPAAALTALARHEDRERVLHAGFQMHLTKPVEPDALVEAVARLTGLKVAT